VLAQSFAHKHTHNSLLPLLLLVSRALILNFWQRDFTFSYFAFVITKKKKAMKIKKFSSNFSLEFRVKNACVFVKMLKKKSFFFAGNGKVDDSEKV